ncbi:MAG: glycosyltransferase [Prevotella sp.]|nr:glycosyltransferase [Prevotella sp.]
MQNQQGYTSIQETQPLVSFIITYYNLPVQMLCECINSILALSLLLAEREVIVIDDGSEVSPMNGLMQYADDIIYVRQRNGGLSAARNAGINMATGKYIQFVDADDYLIPTPYEHCLDILRNHDDANMVLFDFSTTDKASAVFNDALPVSGTEYMRHHNIHGTAWGYLFQKKTLSELRFTPGIWHEDEEFTPQLLLRADNVYATDAKAYSYRQRTGSITSNKDGKDKRLHDIKGVIFRLQNLCDKLPQNDRLALQRRVAQLTMDYIYQVIIQKHSRQALTDCLEELRAKELFPLPDRDYTQKYSWFRRMPSSAVGRTVVLLSLPLLKKER